MFNKFIRYFNQNRIKVIGIILAVIFALIVIQTLNEQIKNENDNRLNEIANEILDRATESSVIGEGETSISTAREDKNIINSFIKYCNEKNIEQAYELLSNDCKEILFPTQEDFINNYYNIVFNEYKEYEMENWITEGKDRTYKIRYTNDVLANGGYLTGSTIEDYYTLIEQNGEYKLNINKFVSKEEINITKTNQNLSITVVSRENYIDYQIYEINFNNTNIDSIKTYDINKNSTWNITDSKGLNYSAFVEEIIDSNLIVESRKQKKLKIKYAKIYNPNRKIESINFNNMYCSNKVQELFNINIEID